VGEDQSTRLLSWSLNLVLQVDVVNNNKGWLSITVPHYVPLSIRDGYPHEDEHLDGSKPEVSQVLAQTTLASHCIYASMNVFNALIRTHHITSRKKVAKLKQAADHLNVFALLRSGGAPGIMYVEGHEQGVHDWVETVNVCMPYQQVGYRISDMSQRLRYKDYQLVSRAAAVHRETSTKTEMSDKSGLHEIATVKDFGQAMRDHAVYAWWRKGMGYANDDMI